MADQREIDATIDRLHEAGATDDEVTAAIKEKYGPPFDVQKQNAIMRGNMAKQPAGTGESDLLTDFATSGPMGDVMTGLNAAHEGNNARAAHNIIKGVSKVVAPAALPFAAAAPMATLGGVVASTVTGALAHKGAQQLSDNPDVADLAGDVGALAGAGPGSKIGDAIPVAPALRFVGGEMARPGGIQGVVGRTVQLGADVADELGHRIRGPLSDILSPSAESTAAAKNAALGEAAKIEAATKEAQHTDALATNRHIDASARLALKKAAAKLKNAPDAVRAQVVPTADAAAAAATPTLPVERRTPYSVEVPDEPNASVDPKVLELRRLLMERSNPNGPSAQGTLQPAEDLTVRRTNTPTHLQEGAGGRGQEAVTDTVVVPKVKAPAPDFIVEGNNGQPIVPARARGLEATMTAEERALIGNRGKGALTLAQRKALLDAIRKRGKQ